VEVAPGGSFNQAWLRYIWCFQHRFEITWRQWAVCGLGLVMFSSEGAFMLNARCVSNKLCCVCLLCSGLLVLITITQQQKAYYSFLWPKSEGDFINLLHSSYFGFFSDTEIEEHKRKMSDVFWVFSTNQMKICLLKNKSCSLVAGQINFTSHQNQKSLEAQHWLCLLNCVSAAFLVWAQKWSVFASFQTKYA